MPRLCSGRQVLAGSARNRPRPRRPGCGGQLPSLRGRLHVSNYLRKPRGGPADSPSVDFKYRFSFCCAREGCRKRLTPPSVRFLGPKVYFGAIIVLVTALRQGPTPWGMRVLKQEFGADRRTISRWQKFWQEIFVRTRFWTTAKARFLPPADEKSLPLSIVDRVEGSEFEEKVRGILRFLAPTTIRGGLVLHAL